VKFLASKFFSVKSKKDASLHYIKTKTNKKQQKKKKKKKKKTNFKIF
jgi:hypothetical protein